MDIKESLKYTQRKSGKIFRLVGTLILVTLTAFLCLAIFSSARLMKQMDIISASPMKIINHTGEIRSRIDSTKVHIERLLYDNTPDSVEEVRKFIQRNDDAIAENMKSLYDQYLGDQKNLDRLNQQLEKLEIAHQELLDYAIKDDRTKEEIYQFLSFHVDEIYTETDRSLEGLLNFANQTFEETYQTAQRIRTETIVSSFLLLGVIGAALLLYKNMFQKQQAEVFYQNHLFEVVSQTVDHVFILNDDDFTENYYVSKNSGRMLGIPAGDLLRDKDLIWGYVPTEDKDRLYQLSLTANLKYWTADFRYTHPITKNEMVFNVQCHRLQNEEKPTERPMVLAVLSDNTDILKGQQELEEATRRAEAANHAKTEFLSHMSHEIRTSVNGMIGMTLMAQQTLEDRDRLADCLRKIDTSAKHLLDLVQDVLDMGKIENGEIDIKKELFSLSDLVESITDVIYVQAEKKGVEFHVSLVGDIQEQLESDSLRLKQIMINLLTNVLEFAPGGDFLTLRIASLRGAGERLWLRFEIIDRGRGIAEENFAKIFAVFEQENMANTDSSLGFSISKHFSELFGGQISVASEEGKGTTFTVDVPFDLRANKKEYPAQFSHMRILLSDENKDDVAHTALLLNRFGIQTNGIQDGEEAVSMAKNAYLYHKPYDICFLGWDTPSLDGLSTMKRIFEEIPKEKRPIVYLVSAHDVSGVAQVARESGAAGVLKKPLFEADICNVLDAVYRVLPLPVGGNETLISDFSGKRFLMVEDNELNMEIALELLKPTNAQVDVATNGQEAVDKVQKAEQGYYDLILMDIQMPVMDGYQATKAIRAMGREDTKKLPILAVTANAFFEDRQKSIDAGMNGYLSKPFQLENLFEKIENLLAEKEENKES